MSLIKTIRILHQIHIDAKTSRVYIYRPEDGQTNFAPGTILIPHQKVANSGLDFVNILCAQSEEYLPILMENNKNHQITLDKGTLGYSALDILDFEQPKNQKKKIVLNLLTANYLETISITNAFYYTRHYHTNQTSEMVYVSLMGTMIQPLKIEKPMLLAYQQMQR